MKFVFLMYWLKIFTYRKVEHHYQSKNSIHKHALEQTDYKHKFTYTNYYIIIQQLESMNN